VTLTFDFVSQKLIWVFYSILPIILWSLNTAGQMELKLCSRNHNFQCKDHCDPDLWTYDAKILRGHVLDMAVHPINFTAVGWLIIKCYWEETVFSYKVIVTLTFDLVTQKTIGVFYSIWTIILWSLNIVG
jgi:hypothetical protein